MKIATLNRVRSVPCCIVIKTTMKLIICRLSDNPFKWKRPCRIGFWEEILFRFGHFRGFRAVTSNRYHCSLGDTFHWLSSIVGLSSFIEIRRGKLFSTSSVSFIRNILKSQISIEIKRIGLHFSLEKKCAWDETWAAVSDNYVIIVTSLWRKR